MQLDYEEAVANAVATVSPKTFIGYHPHEKMFESMKIKSTPQEVFVDLIKKAAPDVKLILPEVKSKIEFPV